MSEHPGQVYQKPTRSCATLSSGVQYLHTAGTWRPCFGLCALTIAAAGPSSTSQVSSPLKSYNSCYPLLTGANLDCYLFFLYIPRIEVQAALL